MHSKIEKRQKFLNPFSLRLIQIVFDLSRKYPFSTKKRKSKAPFFIIGSGRSGSTLLRSMLINHPEVHIPPESAALPGMAKKFIRYGGVDWQDLVSIELGEFNKYKAAEFWDLNLSSIAKSLNQVSKNDRTLSTIVDAVFETHLKEHKPKATIWGDKTPFNTLRLKWINKIYPNAKYIHLVRDGRDVLNSYLKSGLYDDPDYVVWRWNEAVKKASKFKSKKNKNSFITLRYEDLVSNPSKEIEKLYAFLEVENIDYEDNRSFDTMGDTAMEHHANVQNPVNTSSIGKWQKELSPELQSIANQKMEKLLKDFSYL